MIKKTKKGGAYRNQHSIKGSNIFENTIFKAIYKGHYGDIDLIKRTLLLEKEKNKTIFKKDQVYYNFLLSLIQYSIPIRKHIFMYFWGLISNYNPKIEKNTQTLSLEKNVIAYNKIHKIDYNQNIVEGDIVFICIVCKKLYYADLLLDDYIKNNNKISRTGKINNEVKDIFNLLYSYLDDTLENVISKLIIKIIKKIISLGYDINKVISPSKHNCIEHALRKNNIFFIKEMKNFLNLSYNNKSGVLGFNKVDYLFTAFYYSDIEIFDIILSRCNEKNFFKIYNSVDGKIKEEIVNFFLNFHSMFNIEAYIKFFKLFNKISIRNERYLRKVFRENMIFKAYKKEIIINLLLNYDKIYNSVQIGLYMNKFLNFCFSEFIDINLKIKFNSLFQNVPIIPQQNKLINLINIMSLFNVYGAFKYLLNKGANFNDNYIGLFSESLNIIGFITELNIVETYLINKSFEIRKNNDNFDIIYLLGIKNKGILRLELNPELADFIYFNLPEDLHHQFQGAPISTNIVDLVLIMGNIALADFLNIYLIEPTYNSNIKTPITPPPNFNTPPTSELPSYRSNSWININSSNIRNFKGGKRKTKRKHKRII